MRCKYLFFTMKHLLIRLSAGLLLTITATANLPAVSQPASSSSPSAANAQFNNPLLRGVSLTSQQKSQLINLQKTENEQALQVLTPAQRKIASNQGLKGVKLTKSQEQKLTAIARSTGPKYRAIFTPEQIKQIQGNAQALQQRPNGKDSGQK
jgi:hypothetical protein